MSDTYEATALFLRQRVLILQARLAEVERDAARYRWLREQNAILESNTFTVVLDDELGGTWIGADLDYAIDEARATDSAPAAEEGMTLAPGLAPALGQLMREQQANRSRAGAYPDGNPNAGLTPPRASDSAVEVQK